MLSRLLLLVSCVPASEGPSRVASIVGSRLLASPRAISVASPSGALILLILRAFLVVAATSSAGASSSSSFVIHY
jgi:hypothetical protein